MNHHFADPEALLQFENLNNHCGPRTVMRARYGPTGAAMHSTCCLRLLTGGAVEQLVECHHRLSLRRSLHRR